METCVSAAALQRTTVAGRTGLTTTLDERQRSDRPGGSGHCDNHSTAQRSAVLHDRCGAGERVGQLSDRVSQHSEFAADKRLDSSELTITGRSSGPCAEAAGVSAVHEASRA